MKERKREKKREGKKGRNNERKRIIYNTKGKKEG